MHVDKKQFIVRLLHYGLINEDFNLAWLILALDQDTFAYECFD